MTNWLVTAKSSLRSALLRCMRDGTRYTVAGLSMIGVAFDFPVFE